MGASQNVAAASYYSEQCLLNRSGQQFMGLIARRIVCHPQLGEWVRRGDRYGLIRFGSRTDVLLPLTAVAKVKARDRVRGGSTIIAEFESTEG